MTKDELRFLLWVTFRVASLVALICAALAFYGGSDDWQFFAFLSVFSVIFGGADR